MVHWKRASGMVAALLALVGGGRPAQACGGFFCDRPSITTPLPVAQTAENVLFAMEPQPDGNSHLEAHIQIFYTGPADRFSWVVPVDGLPTLATGTNALFQILEPTTRPQFQLALHDEGQCSDNDGSNLSPPGGAPTSNAGMPSASGPGAGGLQVVFHGDVGPFDAAVLKSDDPGALKRWLAENMYYLSDQAGKLIDDYVALQKFFVALKLAPGKGTNEIQPIILRFEGPGPCVPLRLTALAALADLRVNLWVLANNRVVPENFYEIAINEARLDWLRGGANYETLLKEAANEAGGNAFAVEYAGGSDIMKGLLAAPGRYDLTRLRTLVEAPDVLDELARLGFQLDGTLLAILRKHLPEPPFFQQMGIDEVTFYSRLRYYWSTYRSSVPLVDGEELAADVNVQLVQPLIAAQALFDGHPKLTRLVTFISPEEMNVDPTFVENTFLPDVPALHSADAYRECGHRDYTRCTAPLRLVLSDGRTLRFTAPPDGGWCNDPTNSRYDRTTVDAMPALALGWHRDRAGEGRLQFDNRAIIARAIAAQNRSAVSSGRACTLTRSGEVGLWPLLAVVGLVVRLRRRRAAP